MQAFTTYAQSCFDAHSRSAAVVALGASSRSASVNHQPTPNTFGSAGRYIPDHGPHEVELLAPGPSPFECPCQVVLWVDALQSAGGDQAHQRREGEPSANPQHRNLIAG